MEQAILKVTVDLRNGETPEDAANWLRSIWRPGEGPAVEVFEDDGGGGHTLADCLERALPLAAGIFNPAVDVPTYLSRVAQLRQEAQRPSPRAADERRQAGDRWMSCGTDNPGDQQRDLDSPYWAQIGPEGPDLRDWSWTILDGSRENAAVGGGIVDGEKAAKAAVDRWAAELHYHQGDGAPGHRTAPPCRCDTPATPKRPATVGA